MGVRVWPCKVLPWNPCAVAQRGSVNSASRAEVRSESLGFSLTRKDGLVDKTTRHEPGSKSVVRDPVGLCVGSLFQACEASKSGTAFLWLRLS